MWKTRQSTIQEKPDYVRWILSSSVSHSLNQKQRRGGFDSGTILGWLVYKNAYVGNGNWMIMSTILLSIISVNFALHDNYKQVWSCFNTSWMRLEPCTANWQFGNVLHNIQLGGLKLERLKSTEIYLRHKADEVNWTCGENKPKTISARNILHNNNKSVKYFCYKILI